MRAETINTLVADACPPNSYPEQWNVEGLKERVLGTLGLDPPVDEWVKEQAVDPEMLNERISAAAAANMVDKAANIPAESWVQIEKSVMHQSLGHHWQEPLATLAAILMVVQMRDYAQNTPTNQSKEQGHTGRRTVKA